MKLGTSEYGARILPTTSWRSITQRVGSRGNYFDM
jgi:hypothetical protein